MSVSAVTSTGASSSGLVKTANGEYTAASVEKDQKDAQKLGLVKQKDGNYATTPPASTDNATSAQSSASVLTSLAALTLGGS